MMSPIRYHRDIILLNVSQIWLGINEHVQLLKNRQLLVEVEPYYKANRKKNKSIDRHFCR